MKIDLSKYLTQRYIESLGKQEFEGPVITLARESACPAKKVAARLVENLNELKSSRSKKLPWRWIDKEILSQSAKELDLNPAEIEYIFKFEKKNFFDDILSSQSQKYYKSDRRIRKTIAQVVRNIAVEGNVIIVGRGGVSITRELERSLHVLLEAPLGWRVVRNAQEYCMTEKEAMKFTQDVDKKRREFRDHFHGTGTDYTRFDVTYNCMTLSIDEISGSITEMMKTRKFI